MGPVGGDDPVGVQAPACDRGRRWVWRSLCRGVLNDAPVGRVGPGGSRPRRPTRVGRSVVWIVDDGEKIRADALATPFEHGDDNPVWRPGEPARLFAMRNESVAFQVVIETDGARLEGVTVDLPGLDGPDGAKLAKIRRRSSKRLRRAADRALRGALRGRTSASGGKTTASPSAGSRVRPLGDAWVGPVPDALIPVEHAPGVESLPAQARARERTASCGSTCQRAARAGTGDVSRRRLVRARDGARRLARRARSRGRDAAGLHRRDGALLRPRRAGGARWTTGREAALAAPSRPSHRAAARCHLAAGRRQADSVPSPVRSTRASRAMSGLRRGWATASCRSGRTGPSARPTTALRACRRSCSASPTRSSSARRRWSSTPQTSSVRARGAPAGARSFERPTMGPAPVRVGWTCSLDPTAQPVDVPMLHATFDVAQATRRGRKARRRGSTTASCRERARSCSTRTRSRRA